MCWCTSLTNLFACVVMIAKVSTGSPVSGAHLALAKRGSRIALYDLREWLETARQPLPVESLAALSLIGDASCLEPIAKAYARSRDEWWRQHLTDAFRTIIERERITKRKAVMKKIEKKWPEAFRRLAG